MCIYIHTYIDTCNICRPVYHESPEQGFWLGLLSQPSEASHRSSFLKSQGVDLGRLGRRSRVWDLGFGAIGLDLDLDLELWFAGSWAEFEAACERERERQGAILLDAKPDNRGSFMFVKSIVYHAVGFAGCGPGKLSGGPWLVRLQSLSGRCSHFSLIPKLELRAGT